MFGGKEQKLQNKEEQMKHVENLYKPRPRSQHSSEVQIRDSNLAAFKNKNVQKQNRIIFDKIKKNINKFLIEQGFQTMEADDKAAQISYH